MNDGEILEDAPPAEFFEAPTTERARSFLSMISWHNPSGSA
jgi:ABC-type polar amino acid transport system ATPase subunit